jgi:hypothetical protein
MVGLYHSPIPVRRRSYFTRSNDSYLPLLLGRGGGGGQHPGGTTSVIGPVVSSSTVTTVKIFDPKVFHYSHAALRVQVTDYNYAKKGLLI